MKKTILLLLLAATCTAYSQKAVKGKATASKKTTLAKSGAVSADLIQRKGSAAFYILVNKGAKTDSLLVKSIFNTSERMPEACVIKPFTAKGTKLMSLSWTEKAVQGDAKTKLENITETHTEIWNTDTGTRLLENTQKVINITEIVWLDPNKTASKTVDKIRRDGSEFSLTPEGDVLLKNKTQQDKLSYDAAQGKFIGVKSAAAPPKKK